MTRDTNHSSTHKHDNSAPEFKIETNGPTQKKNTSSSEKHKNQEHKDSAITPSRSTSGGHHADLVAEPPIRKHTNNKPATEVKPIKDRVYFSGLIEEFLSKIDSEIDSIKFPEPTWSIYKEEIPPGQELKDKFNLYKNQFKEKKNNANAEDLEHDYLLLQRMQATMYATAKDKFSYKLIDLPLRRIHNPSTACHPISANVALFHEQCFIFYVAAFELIGPQSLPRVTEQELSWFVKNLKNDAIAENEDKIKKLKKSIVTHNQRTKPLLKPNENSDLGKFTDSEHLTKNEKYIEEINIEIQSCQEKIEEIKKN